MGCTIQWPRARLKGRSGAPTMDATHVASVFEFSEHEGENGCTPPMQQMVISSNQHVGSSGHDSNQTPTPTMAIPFVDGLSTNAQRRTYTYREREEHHPYIRRRGEARDSKVTTTKTWFLRRPRSGPIRQCPKRQRTTRTRPVGHLFYTGFSDIF